MFISKMEYKEKDLEAIEVLKDFLPDKIFDAHAHIYDEIFAPSIKGMRLDFNQYKADMLRALCEPKEIRANLIVFPEKSLKGEASETRKLSDEFLINELKLHPECVGEIVVAPGDRAEDIEKRLSHPNVKGLKCYHVYADNSPTWERDIEEYLPESAWFVADKRGMAITLHMVKEKSLADGGNQKYITEMAKKYPNAKLILAHAARSFAAWTGVESVEKIAHIENVLFDFSAVCESPAMLQIIKKAGIKRCMWGSDFPVCRPRGKVVSIGDSFYWIYQNDIDSFVSATPISSRLYIIEGLMAVREASMLADLKEKDLEDLFYNNAKNLWG